MNELTYTLVTDGSSDQALLPILNWLLIQCGINLPIQPQWADLGRLPLRDKPTLAEKLTVSVEFYPCDLLFVHRDAETATIAQRTEEITTAIGEMRRRGAVAVRHVAVVPVRMAEAWLLFDEAAIKHAAGNRNYAGSLDLPTLREAEQLPDPKEILYDALKRASNLHGRRLRNFPVRSSARRVTEFIGDFSPLRTLPAFQVLEASICGAVAAHGWSVQSG